MLSDCRPAARSAGSCTLSACPCLVPCADPDPRQLLDVCGLEPGPGGLTRLPAGATQLERRRRRRRRRRRKALAAAGLAPSPRCCSRVLPSCSRSVSISWSDLMPRTEPKSERGQRALSCRVAGGGACCPELLLMSALDLAALMGHLLRHSGFCTHPAGQALLVRTRRAGACVQQPLRTPSRSQLDHSICHKYW